VENKEVFQRYEGNPVITADMLDYSANTIFNPAATIFRNEVLLLNRVEERSGFSHFTKATSEDGFTNWQIESKPTLKPEPKIFPEEEWGIEDPRITFLPEIGKYAIAYTAYSRRGPVVSLALTEDFEKFERMGAVTEPNDKDAALFPEKIDGRWAMIHRYMATGDKKGHMWVSFSDNFLVWKDKQILLKARGDGWWDANKIGLSPQPIKTEKGWLIMYHGVRVTANGGLYRLGLALLDLEKPTRVLARTREWILGPKEEYERVGDVNNVVFPCGWIHNEGDDTIVIYYGCADTCVGIATAKMKDVLKCLQKH